MQRQIVVRAEAAADAMEASHWYAQRAEGLGIRFLEHLDQVLISVRDAPLSFPLHQPNIHRARIPNFPYGIFFAFDESRIHVLAIMSLVRDPRLIRRTLRNR
jgi:hypothetical protein